MRAVLFLLYLPAPGLQDSLLFGAPMHEGAASTRSQQSAVVICDDISEPIVVSDRSIHKQQVVKQAVVDARFVSGFQQFGSRKVLPICGALSGNIAATPRMFHFTDLHSVTNPQYASARLQSYAPSRGVPNVPSNDGQGDVWLVGEEATNRNADSEERAKVSFCNPQGVPRNGGRFRSNISQVISCVCLRLHLSEGFGEGLVTSIQSARGQFVGISDLKPLQTREDGIDDENGKAHNFNCRCDYLVPVIVFWVGMGAGCWGLWRIRWGHSWRHAWLGICALLCGTAASCIGEVIFGSGACC